MDELPHLPTNKLAILKSQISLARHNLTIWREHETSRWVEFWQTLNEPGASSLDLHLDMQRWWHAGCNVIKLQRYIRRLMHQIEEVRFLVAGQVSDEEAGEAKHRLYTEPAAGVKPNHGHYRPPKGRTPEEVREHRRKYERMQRRWGSYKEQLRNLASLTEMEKKGPE